jgi:hypothetical protein
MFNFEKSFNLSDNGQRQKHIDEIAYICYVSVVLKVDSEVVISFFNRANPFHRVCLFCNFVRNRIYVIKIEMFKPVFMAR